jgi:hypothetical protein
MGDVPRATLYARESNCPYILSVFTMRKALTDMALMNYWIKFGLLATLKVAGLGFLPRLLTFLMFTPGAGEFE